MRFGVYLPIFDGLADPGLLADLASQAERAGWDGIFYWDHIYYRAPVQAVTDPWTAIAAAAMRTERIQLGVMVTPLARRRPHVLARQIVAVDQLSGGRFVFGVGLGLDSSGGELSRFGEEPDDRRRAAMLDEGLDLVVALMSGQEVDHHGEHYLASQVRFLPTPVRGHVPVWVAARWPHRRPLKRAARHDGVFLIDLDSPASLADALATIGIERGAELTGYEVVVVADPSSGPDAWHAAGATWLLAGLDAFTSTRAAALSLIERGPPG